MKPFLIAFIILVSASGISHNAYATSAGDNGDLLLNQNGYLELTNPDTLDRTIIQSPYATSVNDFAIAPNGETILINYSYDDNFDGTYDRTVLKFKSATDSSWGFELPADTSFHYSFSPDSRFVAYASYDTSTGHSGLDILDLSDGSIVEIEEGMNAQPEWSPTEDAIAYSKDGSIYMIDLNTGATSLVGSAGSGGFITDWSPDGSTLAIIQNDSVYFLDITSGVLTNFDPSNIYGMVSSAAFSPDGTKFAFVDWSASNTGVYVTDGFSSSDTTRMVSTTDLRGGVEWQTLNGADTSVPSYPLSNRYPIYRFYSPVVKHHLFTSDSYEAQYINSSMQGVWRAEGSAFSVNQTSNCQADRSVYRFYSDLLKTHLFTMDEYEKSQIIANYPVAVWRYEGIAYYAYPN